MNDYTTKPYCVVAFFFARPIAFARVLPTAVADHPLWAWFFITALASAPIIVAHVAEARVAAAAGGDAMAFAMSFTGPALLTNLGLFTVPLAFVVCRNVMAAAANDLPGFLKPTDGVQTDARRDAKRLDRLPDQLRVQRRLDER